MHTPSPLVFQSPKGEPRYYWSMYKLSGNNVTRGVSIFSKKTARQKCISETLERVYVSQLHSIFASAVGQTRSFARQQCLFEALERSILIHLSQSKKKLNSLTRKVFAMTKLEHVFHDAEKNGVHLFLYQYPTSIGVYHIICKAEFIYSDSYTGVMFGSKCHTSLRMAVVGSIEEALSRIPWAKKHLSNSKLSFIQLGLTSEESHVYKINSPQGRRVIQNMYLNDESKQVKIYTRKKLSFLKLKKFISAQSYSMRIPSITIQKTIKIKKGAYYFSYIQN